MKGEPERFLIREKDRDCMHVSEEQRCTKKLKNECIRKQRYNVSIETMCRESNQTIGWIYYKVRIVI